MVGVLKEALKLVEPTPRDIETVDRVAKRSYDLVKKYSSKFEGIVDIVFGGSYEKGTWLKGDVDVDIFVKIRSDVSEQQFEKI